MAFPIIPIIMAAAALTKSVTDMQKSKQQEKAARDAMKAIEHGDPSVQALIAGIRQRRDYAESGMTKGMALKRTLINDSAQQTAANLARGTGGSGATLIDSLLRNANIQQRNLAAAGADTEALSTQYLQMETPLVMDQSYRKLGLQQHAADTQAAQAAVNKSDANANFYGSLSALSGVQFNGRSNEEIPYGTEGGVGSGAVEGGGNASGFASGAGQGFGGY